MAGSAARKQHRDQTLDIAALVRAGEPPPHDLEEFESARAALMGQGDLLS